MTFSPGPRGGSDDGAAVASGLEVAARRRLRAAVLHALPVGVRAIAVAAVIDGAVKDAEDALPDGFTEGLARRLEAMTQG